MTQVTLDITVSLDGFVAGPDASLEHPLGIGGERLHAWAVVLEAFQRQHGRSGGEVNADTPVLEEMSAGVGAHVMGRRMFSGGSGRWADDPNPNGWWGAEPPFGGPVFVLTHHERAPLELGATTFHFVTEGVDAAFARARGAAGDGRIALGGGADVARQALAAGHLDEIRLHIAPILLGAGVRLFDGVGPDIGLTLTRTVASPAVTHLWLAVDRST